MDRLVKGDVYKRQEFTSIELYQAFTDFHGMMDLVEELYKRCLLYTSRCV